MNFESVWLAIAPHTVLDYHKIKNIQFLLEDTLARGVPGDTCECGVYRGGVSVLMAKILEVGTRHHLMFDSFTGLPPLNPEKDLPLYQQGTLACPADKVIDLMNDLNLTNVEIYPGWFHDTLPKLPHDRAICLAHIDCDLYDSTVTCLEEIYPRLSPGGVMIFDDYFDISGGERRAVDDFLNRNHNELLFAGPVEQVFFYKGRKLQADDLRHLYRGEMILGRHLSLEHLENDLDYAEYLRTGKIMSALPGGSLTAATKLAHKTIEIHRLHKEIAKQLGSR